MFIPVCEVFVGVGGGGGGCVCLFSKVGTLFVFLTLKEKNC